MDKLSAPRISKVFPEKIQQKSESKLTVSWLITKSTRRGHLVTSFAAVFLAVLSCLVMTTILQYGPLIFLRMAEDENGIYDGVVYPTSPRSPLQSLDDFRSRGVFIDFLRVAPGFNLAPRKQYCGSVAGSV